MTSANPLISTQESSGSNFEVALHPLVLLSISDYVTRHKLRQQAGPVVGALLGQQNGRQVSIEHAFECLVIDVDGQVLLDQSWFDERIQQMKDVHNSPTLDIVGWYTTLPSTGPQSIHLPIHLQILQNYNESTLLLGFHSNLIGDDSGGKLPLTIYESNFEADTIGIPTEDNKNIKDDDSKPSIKFKEISYSVESGEAEMISVDFVARGGGNASVVDGTETNLKDNTRTRAIGQESRLEAGIDDKNDKISADERILLREEEELIASLTAKMNAIRMLQSRINLISMFLKEIHYSNDSNELDHQENSSTKNMVLRSIQALLSRLALLVPENSTGYKQEIMSEQNDVNLISLLSTITENIKDIREVGQKHGLIESLKTTKNKSSNHWAGQSQKGVSGVGDLLS